MTMKKAFIAAVAIIGLTVSFANAQTAKPADKQAPATKTATAEKQTTHQPSKKLHKHTTTAVKTKTTKPQ
jgi:hypothetical protein